MGWEAKRSSHRIEKPLTPWSLDLREGRGGIDVSTHLEGQDFAIRKRLEIEVIYGTVIRGLPLEILIIWTICGE